MSDEDATVRELVNECMRVAAERDQHILSFDFEPEEIGDYVLMVVAIGKDARNNMARILNTFMDYEGEEK